MNSIKEATDHLVSGNYEIAVLRLILSRIFCFIRGQLRGSAMIQLRFRGEQHDSNLNLTPGYEDTSALAADIQSENVLDDHITNHPCRGHIKNALNYHTTSRF